MRADNPFADNLFNRLFSYTPREGRTALEDFCTESLAWCLRNSAEFRERLFRRVLELLSASQQARFPADQHRSIEVHTQLSFSGEDEDRDGKKGRFDLVIQSKRADRFVVVVEVKVDSDFADPQLPRYRKELDYGKSFDGAKAKSLICLTKRRYEVGKMNVDAALVWSDVQQILQETSASTMCGNRDADSTHSKNDLLGQFAEFLKSKGMHHMRIPGISLHEDFGRGVEFCCALQQLMLEVRNGSSDLRSVIGDKVEWSEKDGFWMGLAKKDFWIWFRFRPHPMMQVEASAAVTFVPPAQMPENMAFEVWQPLKNGFTIAGEFGPEYDGNADKIREWFEQAARLAMKLREGE